MCFGGGGWTAPAPAAPPAPPPPPSKMDEGAAGRQAAVDQVRASQASGYQSTAGTAGFGGDTLAARRKSPRHCWEADPFRWQQIAAAPVTPPAVPGVLNLAKAEPDPSQATFIAVTSRPPTPPAATAEVSCLMPQTPGRPSRQPSEDNVMCGGGQSPPPPTPPPPPAQSQVVPPQSPKASPGFPRSAATALPPPRSAPAGRSAKPRRPPSSRCWVNEWLQNPGLRNPCGGAVPPMVFSPIGEVRHAHSGSLWLFFPWGIYVREEYKDAEWLLRHEIQHAKQRARDGFVAYWLKRSSFICKYGYVYSPYEIEARAAQSAD